MKTPQKFAQTICEKRPHPRGVTYYWDDFGILLMTSHDSWLLTCWPMILHSAKVSVAVWGAIVGKLSIHTFWGETDWIPNHHIKTIYPDCIQVQESPISREYLCHVNMFQFGMPCVSEWRRVARRTTSTSSGSACPWWIPTQHRWKWGMMLGTTGFLREEARAKYLCSIGSVDDFLKENSYTFVALMKQYTNVGDLLPSWCLLSW